MIIKNFQAKQSLTLFVSMLSFDHIRSGKILSAGVDWTNAARTLYRISKKEYSGIIEQSSHKSPNV